MCLYTLNTACTDNDHNKIWSHQSEINVVDITSLVPWFGGERSECDEHVETKCAPMQNCHEVVLFRCGERYRAPGTKTGCNCDDFII